MTSRNGTFYITTPIYYVNDVPHIGHAYTTVATDCLARYKRLKGFDVFFLTGTDEHGQKVEKAAEGAGLPPQEFVDNIVPNFIDLWRVLEVSYDDFIRTTEERHKAAATRLWEMVTEAGDIYLGEYEDWYCTPCETFWTETQLNGGRCPDCSREVEKLKEESYFFRLSKYAEELTGHIERNPGFIRPESKRNEILSFVREGLRDISISRTTFSWGVPVPDNPKHIMYVWFEALTNYLTATGFPDRKFEKWWPADVHVIGKDILRFHSVYWPAFLMSAGLTPPRTVFAHGWWTVEGQKMSKSKGNVVDPFEMADTFGTDAFRYFLLREVRFGLDGDFSVGALKQRINSDLANDLGNLLSRSVSMIRKYREGVVPAPDESKDRPELEGAVKSAFRELPVAFCPKMEELNFYDALSGLWDVIRTMNGYVDKAAPWKEEDGATLDNVLYTLAEGLRLLAPYIQPFMPSSAEKIWETIGVEKSVEGTDFDAETGWGGLEPGVEVKKARPLFPRVE